MTRSRVRLTLPSGRAVVLVRKSAPGLPWDIYYEQGHCLIGRPRRGDSSRVEYYSEENKSTPLVLDERDATAVLAALEIDISRKKAR